MLTYDDKYNQTFYVKTRVKSCFYDFQIEIFPDVETGIWPMTFWA